jgi:hypothetical protein
VLCAGRREPSSSSAESWLVSLLCGRRETCAAHKVVLHPSITALGYNSVDRGLAGLLSVLLGSHICLGW